jgi:hypothetical protein
MYIIEKRRREIGKTNTAGERAVTTYPHDVRDGEQPVELVGRLGQAHLIEA